MPIQKLANTLRFSEHGSLSSFDTTGSKSKSLPQKKERMKKGHVIPEWRIAPNNLMVIEYKPPNSTIWRDHFDSLGIGITIQTLVNPTTITESVDPQYSKRPVLGLSHEVVQYIRTPSRTLSFQLWISHHVYQQRGWIGKNIDPLHMKQFWQGMSVPFSAGLPPPLVKISMPGLSLNFAGVVDSLSINYEQLSIKGDPLIYTVDISMIEAPEKGLMTTDKVFSYSMGPDSLNKTK